MAILRNNPLPLYYQVKKLVEKELSTFEHSKPIPTETDLCNRYKVSRITVRRALSDLVNEGILYRIPGNGTFVSHRREVLSMRQQERLKKIAIIMPDVGHFFFPVILRGICDEAEKIGYNVLIYNTDNSNRKEATLLRDLTGKVRAFIIAPSTEEEGSRIYFRDLKYRGIPFVLIDRYIPNIETDYVVTDNENGAYEGVKYLINLGHKRIGHITGENSTPHLARKEGYQRALEEAEIGFDVSLVKKGKVGDDKCGYEMTREFLQMSERPTAIFAVNDWVALGAIEAIKESNLTIPEDISLLGYDDSHIVASLKVPLTTVAQPKYEIGKSAVEVLKKRFESKSGEIQKVVLKSKLVVRDSCSSPRKVQELMCHSNY